MSKVQELRNSRQGRRHAVQGPELQKISRGFHGAVRGLRKSFRFWSVGDSMAKYEGYTTHL